MRKKQFSMDHMDHMDAVMQKSPFCPSGPPVEEAVFPQKELRQKSIFAAAPFPETKH
jgi:hypothetical protein